MEKLLFVQYPPCGTCRKAKKYLEEHNIPFESRHIVDNPPTKDELRKWVQRSGLDVKKFFNTSGLKYKELGLKDKVKSATDDELLELLASDGMLVKRPIVTDGSRVTVGFKEEQFQQWNVK